MIVAATLSVPGYILGEVAVVPGGSRCGASDPGQRWYFRPDAESPATVTVCDEQDILIFLGSEHGGERTDGGALRHLFGGVDDQRSAAHIAAGYGGREGAADGRVDGGLTSCGLRVNEAMAERAGDAVRDVNGRITYWNRGAEQIYGYSRAQASGQLAHELLHTTYEKRDVIV